MWPAPSTSSREAFGSRATKRFSEWHLGRLAGADGLRSGRISVAGPPSLARALPGWNRLSGWAHLGIKPMTA
jgi:hypothetical protein